jgi:K+-sensing histidine kinase KdpD
MPKTPEQWLAAAKPAEKTKGALKLFLGYAPGVGKTFSMLSEAIRRHSRGEDVVIGVVDARAERHRRTFRAIGDHPAENDRLQRDALRGAGSGRDSGA